MTETSRYFLYLSF